VELHDFLEKLITGNPYNKYCLDCKKAKSTHFLVWLGIFTCKNCSDEHLMNSSQSKVYVKERYEHWDDFQIKSAVIGGNKKLFSLLKE